MFGTMLICVGILAVVFGLIVRSRHRASTTRALRVARLTPKRLAQVADHQRVRVDGLAVAAETDHLLVGPCSGLPAIWFRVRVHRIVGATGGDAGATIWQVAIEEQQGIPFSLLDRYSQCARVVAGEAEVLTDTCTFRDSPGRLSAEATQRVGEFLSGRGHAVWLGDLFEEHCICPGEPVSVVGVASRGFGPPLGESYRNSPSSVLVFEATPEGRPVVATPAAVRHERYGVRLLSTLAVAVGLVAMAAGFVIREAWRWTM
jgi:hypothetical protein